MTGILGKLIGGMTGFAMGGPLGAVFGAAAGHMVDKVRTHAAQGLSGLASTSGQAVFTFAVVALGVKLAKVDGAVNRAEIEALRAVFRVAPADEATLARLFDRARNDPFGYDLYARQLAWLHRHDRGVLEDVVAALFHIACADGAIQPSELGYLRHVATILGLNGQAFDRLRATFASGGSPDPYAVLGLTSSVSDEVVKRTYRSLIREHHPDALAAGNAAPEIIELANERMAAINAAYDRVRKARGFR